MYLYNIEKKQIIAGSGGYQEKGLLIRDTYVRIGTGFHSMHSMFYEPVVPVEKSRIGVIIIHSDDDYSIFPIGGELAKRGYRTLCGQVIDPDEPLEQKMIDIKHAVEFMRNYSGIEKVILMGHSGGATLMSAYQSAAEKGVKIYQGSNMLVKCTLDEELSPADGLMTLDSNWGNGSMTLFSVDPAVIEVNGSVKIDPELDIFNPVNGFDPEGSEYSEAFIKKFLKAQAERNNAIIKKALERLFAIEKGNGYYVDDEPFCMAGTAQLGPFNKLFPQDIRLLSHSKKPYVLLHGDGSATEGIVPSVRRPRGELGKGMSRYMIGAVKSTVRSFLTNRAVLAGKDYDIREDGAYGILWNDTFNCTPGNIRNVNAPLLIMGMTGSYEGLAAEEIYSNAAGTDKTIAFVEGAGHNFDNQGREEFGDTQKIVFDYADKWMSTSGRFID